MGRRHRSGSACTSPCGEDALAVSSAVLAQTLRWAPWAGTTREFEYIKERPSNPAPLQPSPPWAKLAGEWQNCAWPRGGDPGQKLVLPEAPTLSPMGGGVAEKAAQPKALVTSPGPSQPPQGLRVRKRRRSQAQPKPQQCLWCQGGARRAEEDRDLAHHAAGTCQEVLPCPCRPEAQPAWAASSGLAVCGAVSQGVGNLAEGGPVLGAEGPAALHQPVELGRAALRLWESGLPSLQVCRKMVGGELVQLVPSCPTLCGAGSTHKQPPEGDLGWGSLASGWWALTQGVQGKYLATKGVTPLAPALPGWWGPGPHSTRGNQCMGAEVGSMGRCQWLEWSLWARVFTNQYAGISTTGVAISVCLL